MSDIIDVQKKLNILTIGAENITQHLFYRSFKTFVGFVL
jgi:hypothetical protein